MGRMYEDNSMSIGRTPLGCEDAHPDFLHRWIGRPEIHKLGEVAAALHHRAGDGAVDRNVVTLDIAKDSIIRGRLAARIMFRLQSIDRDRQLQIRQRGPRQWDRTERAGHNLDMGAFDQLRQQDLKLAVTNEWVAANDRPPGARREMRRHSIRKLFRIQIPRPVGHPGLVRQHVPR